MNSRPTGRPTPGITPVGSPTGTPIVNRSVAPPISLPSLPPVPPISTARPPLEVGAMRMFVVIDKKSGQAIGQYQFCTIILFPSLESARAFALKYYKVSPQSYTLSQHCEIKPATIAY